MVLSVVAESWAVGPLPHKAEAISIVPGHDGRGVEHASPRPARRICDPGEQPVERVLADDEAAVAALVVEVVRVPFAEDVVGPAVGRVVVIIRPRIDRQFVQQGWVELGLVEASRRRSRTIVWIAARTKS